MLKNYFKVTVRNIAKHKGYSFINIIGLSLAMISCILIMLWVQDELSYDGFHENKNKLYRVLVDDPEEGFVESSWTTCAPLGPTLKEKYPEIESFSRFLHVRNRTVRYNDKIFNEAGIVLLDPDIFQMFSFPLIMGHPETALINPNSILITEEMVEKYFGEVDPIGKSLTIDDKYEMKITGVLKNIPGNSHIQFDFVAPYKMIEVFMHEWGDQLNNWTLSGAATYVMLKENSSVEDVTDKIENIIGVYREGSDNKLRLQPFGDIYLHSNHLESSIRIQGNIQYVYIFSIIGCFIILIACINFINLSTAKSADRAREIGIRKAVGARKMQLMGQLICESILIVEIAIIISLVCVELLIPLFNELSGKTISLALINSPDIIMGYLGFGVVLGFISGIYPAIVLTKFHPAKVLKGQNGGSQSNVFMRRVLVVFQFTLSILLIIGTIIVSNQLNYMQNKDLGFDKDQLISINIPKDISGDLESLKTELIKEHNILSASAVSSKPTNGRFFTTASTDWEGKVDDRKMNISFVAVDYDYIETFNMKMSEGAYYSKDIITDTTNGIVLNETAIKTMGLESPIGKRFSFNDNDLNIIGVVKDYCFQSLYNNIEPLALAFIPQMYRHLYIKIDTEDIPSTMASIENVWDRFASGHPFEYQFLNEDYEKLYAKERKMNTIFIYFTILAIVIASMGLFGLVSFVAEKRTKEIGIRKVLGASVSSIANMITKEFVLLTVISNLIAWPIAYYFTNKWLNGFAYRIEYEVSTFLVTSCFALAITLLSVGYRAIKAATSNPIHAIRQE